MYCEHAKGSIHQTIPKKTVRKQLRKLGMKTVVITRHSRYEFSCDIIAVIHGISQIIIYKVLSYIYIVVYKVLVVKVSAHTFFSLWAIPHGKINHFLHGVVQG